MTAQPMRQKAECKRWSSCASLSKEFAPVARTVSCLAPFAWDAWEVHGGVPPTPENPFDAAGPQAMCRETTRHRSSPALPRLPSRGACHMGAQRNPPRGPGGAYLKTPWRCRRLPRVLRAPPSSQDDNGRPDTTDLLPFPVGHRRVRRAAVGITSCALLPVWHARGDESGRHGRDQGFSATLPDSPSGDVASCASHPARSHHGRGAGPSCGTLCLAARLAPRVTRSR